MRTTLTLDDDLFEQLRALAHRTRRPFKTVVNEAIRNGLAQPRPKPARYRLKPSSLGSVRQGLDLDRALRIADELEDQAIASRLERRK